MNRLVKAILLAILAVAFAVTFGDELASAQDVPFVEPVADIFLEKGVLGAIIVAEAIVIIILFRLLVASWRERLTETKEMARLVATNTSVLERLEIALAKR